MRESRASSKWGGEAKHGRKKKSAQRARPPQPGAVKEKKPETKKGACGALCVKCELIGTAEERKKGDGFIFYVPEK